MPPRLLTREQFNTLSNQDKAKYLKTLERMKERAGEDGPRNDDELHEWIREHIGINYSRTAVCPDHDAPFDFVAAVYFNKVTSALLMANRGGGKTFGVALVHYLNSLFKPGYWGLTFGATQAQSKRAYEHLTAWVYERYKKDDGSEGLREKEFINRSIEERTELKNGSKVEIVTATKKAVNGPHPNLAHADEVEQIEEEPWDESRNMAMASRDENGNMIPAQDVLTSTRKGAMGRMQQLLDSCADAIKKGFKPPYTVFKFCTYETTEEVPYCRNIPDDERQARLRELGMDERMLCDCDKVVSARSPVWNEDGPYKDTELKIRWYNQGDPRTMDTVCRGRFFRSRGWRPLAEVQNTFQQNNRAVWEAQQECSRPETEGNYITWEAGRDEVYDFFPDPANGPIYMGVDWGGTNPHAVVWLQRLNHPAKVRSAAGEEYWLKEESIVAFDEIYSAEISTAQLAGLVKEREAYWRRECRARGLNHFIVSGRYTDPQGKPHRIEFRRQGLKSSWPVKTRNWDYITDELIELHEQGQLYADPDRCSNFCSEVLVWRKNPKTGNQIDEFNHAIDAVRYAVANINKVDHRAAKKKTAKNATDKKRVPNASRRGAVGSVRRNSNTSDPFAPGHNPYDPGSLI